MKKLIVLTALITAISSFIYGDNLENIKFKTEYGIGHIHDSKQEYSQFANELGGRISLDDLSKELKFNFDVTRRDFLDVNKDYGGYTWDLDFNLMKPFKIGNKDLEFVAGVKYGDSVNLSVVYLDGLIPLKQSDGHGYEFYMGTAIPVSIFGQHGAITPRIVYYNEDGLYTRDYKNRGTEGWGGDFDIAFGGPIVAGKYGEITYGLMLNNHWRDATDTKGSLSDGKNSVYLNYIGILTYSTPRYYGFGFDLNVINQWEKFTGDNQSNNGFYISPKVLYMHTFDTSVGKLTINPYVSYNVVDDQTRDITLDKDYDYSGNKELTGGIQFTLDRK